MTPAVLTLLGLAAAASGSPAAGADDAAAVVERRLVLMGTEAEVRVTGAERPAALAASEAAVEALEEAEARLSTWTSTGELARLNRAPVGQSVALSPRLAAELAAADGCRRATGGAFDPAVGPLVEAWGLRRGGRLPSPEEVVAARLASRPDGLALHDGPTAVRLRADLRLEEGGFGKGAALDAALERLAADPAVAAARLDLGGQVALYRRPGRPAVVTELAVAHPRDRSLPVVALTLPGGSLATSGNSERGITVAGERRSHLLDPRTGEPAPDFGSLTVWAPGALEADCLSTGLYVLGPDAALAWASEHPGIEVLVLRPVGEDGAVEAIATPGLAGSLRALDRRLVREVRFVSGMKPPAQEAGSTGCSRSEVGSSAEGAETPLQQGARPRHSQSYAAGSGTKLERMDRRPNTIRPPSGDTNKTERRSPGSEADAATRRSPSSRGHRVGAR